MSPNRLTHSSGPRRLQAVLLDWSGVPVVHTWAVYWGIAWRSCRVFAHLDGVMRCLMLQVPGPGEAQWWSVWRRAGVAGLRGCLQAGIISPSASHRCFCLRRVDVVTPTSMKPCHVASSPYPIVRDSDAYCSVGQARRVEAEQPCCWRASELAHAKDDHCNLTKATSMQIFPCS